MYVCMYVHNLYLIWNTKNYNGIQNIFITLTQKHSIQFKCTAKK